MPKDIQLKTELARWISNQSKYSNLRDMASVIGIPFNTLRGYFSGKRPSGENFRKLADATGLDLKSDAVPKVTVRDRVEDDRKKRAYAVRLLEDLQYDLTKCLESLSPVREALIEGTPHTHGIYVRRKAQLVQALLDALQRNLEGFIGNQEALRQLRQIVSGSDAGYLSGLLVAIFDDRRLQTWKEMTTYKYGSR